ncbi:MAG: site-specific DNA-methyltransferase [Deltaproteobacteria bacterium]|nr:site-specific DNA-methyltransferase [Deltaproteobacteria bacterium]
MRSLPEASVRLVVADPPYGVRKAEWDTFASREAYIAWSEQWLAAAARVLTPDGSAYVMGFSEVLADVKQAAMTSFEGCRWLVWHYRNKANLGKDWGRSHESILHLRKSRNFVFHVDAVRIPYNAHTQKYPARKQGETSAFKKGRGSSWTPHPLGAKPRDVLEIPILNNGMAEKTPHPTQKPLELIRRLVVASSDEDDLVIDPFSGSGTTSVVCEITGRRWAVCDQDADYCGYAQERLERVVSGEFGVDDLMKTERSMRANRRKVRG